MKILKDLYNILMPRRCIVCKGTLEPNEEYLCTSCSIQMPRYQIKSIEDNEVLRKAWNFAPIEYGATLLYYRHQSNYHNIIINAKYKGKTEMGAHMGQWAAIEIDSLKLAEKIDIIVPVPPDKERKKKRGYNQAEIIANGIGKAMQRPVRNFLIKKGSGESQTKLDQTARKENVTDTYKANIPTEYKGKRILLVDDVLTTGATIGNCAQAILANDPQAKISILTLAINAK